MELRRKPQENEILVVSSSGGEGEARRLFDGAYTAGEIFLTSTTLQLKAKAKCPLYLGKAATSGTIENVGASAPAPKRWGQNQWGQPLVVVLCSVKV